jgi:hypothetical protein
MRKPWLQREVQVSRWRGRPADLAQCTATALSGHRDPHRSHRPLATAGAMIQRPSQGPFPHPSAKGPPHVHAAPSAHDPGPPARRPQRPHPGRLPPGRPTARRVLPHPARSPHRTASPRLLPPPQERPPLSARLPHTTPPFGGGPISRGIPAVRGSVFAVGGPHGWPRRPPGHPAATTTRVR